MQQQRPGFPPRSRHVDSFAPAQSGCRPVLRIVCLARFPAARLWLKDESLEDSANLPAPDVIAREIVEDLEAALSQFATIATDAGNSYKGTNDAELPQARKDQPQKPS